MAEWTDPETAAAVMREAGLEPLEPFVDADRPWRCRCLTCNRVVTPRLSRMDAGGGCKYCATRGLDLNAPAVVFVLSNADLNAHLVGFDAADGDAVTRHARTGWALVKRASVPTVEEAYEIDLSVLRWLRGEMGLAPGPSTGDATPDAATVGADDIAVTEVWARVSSELSRRRRLRRERGSRRG